MKDQLKQLILITSFFIISASLQAQESPNFSERVDHAMNRMAFSVGVTERAQILAGGEDALKKWIQEQLEPEKINDGFVDTLLSSHETLFLSIEELQQRFKNKENQNLLSNKDPNEIRLDWSSAKLVRAVFSRRQLYERLVDFWYNHFNVDQKKGKVKWFFGPYERDAIRPFVFGRFIDMLRSTARHPAMLFYLDNHLSRGRTGKQGRSSGLNENYGRELLELHTLGVNGGYTQQDVIETARVFTGWSIANLAENASFQFKPNFHDPGPKKVLNWDFTAGHGVEEGEELLHKLAEHPSTARHLSTLLVQYFVANPAPASLVTKVSQAFQNSRGYLPTVYRTLFESSEFWQSKYHRSLLKDHFQWLVSAIRVLNGEVIWKNSLIGWLNQLGTPLYQCSPPTGYKSLPEDLINSNTLIRRLNFALKLAGGHVDGVYLGESGLGQTKAENSEQLMQLLATNMGVHPLSSSTISSLKQEIISGPWQTFDKAVRPFVLSRLIGLILASPEFQRM
ncbi:MAG: DUF1800 domain-containing protein [Bdellovibrionales bacterium]|nr:DUF1800 domain-containing protein [Bdellovibrionales bacterium]